MAAAAAAAAAQMAVNAFIAHLAAIPAPVPAAGAPAHHANENFVPQPYLNRANPVPMSLDLENVNSQIRRINSILQRPLDGPAYKTGLPFNIFVTEMTVLLIRNSCSSNNSSRVAPTHFYRGHTRAL